MNTVVYTKDNCGYCVKAKSLLGIIHANYSEKKIANDQDKLDLLAVVPNARTLPQIFLSGTYVGGFDALERLHKEGKLKVTDNGDISVS
jgi:glutaredoxin 3